MRRLALATASALLCACTEPNDGPNLDAGRSADLTMTFGDEPDLAAQPGPDLLGASDDDMAPGPDLLLPPLPTLSFGAAATVPATEWPVDLVSADFNMDGRMDLVVALIRTKQLLVLLGKGDGTFQPGVAVPLPNVAGALAVGDFNADKHKDVAVQEYGPGFVDVVLGQGNGRFEAPVRYPIEEGSFVIAAGDFDGDRRDDVATVGINSGRPNVLLSRPDGTLKPYTSLPAMGGTTYYMAADLDGDGRADLVVPSMRRLAVYFSQGNGSFAAPLYLMAGQLPFTAAVLDFDLDGKPDIAVQDNHSGSLQLARGAGRRMFDALKPVADVPSFGLGVADFNRDGYPDLASADDNGAVAVLRNQAGVSFAPPLRTPTAMNAQGMAIADYDKDGLPDIAVVNKSANLVTVILNTSH